MAIFLIPLAGLVARAPWSRLGEILSSPVVTDALWLSMISSLAATALSGVVGIPLAWLIARVDFPGRSVVRGLVTLPLVLPPVVGGAALLFALGRPVMPVDTHVFRVNRRLDFIGEGVSREDAHGMMTAITPDEDIYSYHVNTVTHGRRICKARQPRCAECVVNALCPSEVFE